jgi:hypothetical protein
MEIEYPHVEAKPDLRISVSMLCLVIGVIVPIYSNGYAGPWMEEPGICCPAQIKCAFYLLPYFRTVIFRVEENSPARMV